MKKSFIKKPILVLLSLFLLLSVFVGLTVLSAAAESDGTPYAIFDSSAGTLTFAVGTKTAVGVVRANGDTVSGDNFYTGFTTATYADRTDVPWYAQRENITKVVFLDSVSPVSTAYWFYSFSNLTDFEGLSMLDTSNVTDMRAMFSECSSLTTLDVSGFDTSNVTSMNGMFYWCNGLMTLDVSGFNTSKATDLSSMFLGCWNLKALDVHGFDTSNVTDMRTMFGDCSSLTTLALRGFDTSDVGKMESMFIHCIHLTSLDLSSFNTSRVTDMSNMFNGCRSLTSLDVSSFDTANVTNMENMFLYCDSLTSLDVRNFVTSRVTTMEGMFYNCSGLTSLDVSEFNTSNVTSMRNMFDGCSGLTSLNVCGFDTSNVTIMSYMFRYCSSLLLLDLGGFNTSKVTDMRYMFLGCSNLTSLDLSKFVTSRVTSMNGVFYNCSGLVSLDVSGFNTANVTKMDDMFLSCSSLTSLDLSGFDTSNVTDMSNMFYGCSSLSSLTMGENFAFKSNANLPNVPTTGTYTGKWIRDNSEDAALTASELMVNYNGATMAGTYVWECVHYFTDDPTWTWAADYSSATAVFNCTNCGKELGSVTDNEIETEEVSAATCTANQVIKYVASVELNGVTYIGKTDAITVDGTAGHVLVNHDAKAPTCTEIGWDAYQTCENCDYTTYVEIPATGNHTTILINAREATYDADGYTGDTYCTVCRQTLSYGSVIPKLTKPEEPTNPTQPTTQQQQQSGNCKYCGGTHTGFPGIIIGFIHSILAMFGLHK